LSGRIHATYAGGSCWGGADDREGRPGGDPVAGPRSPTAPASPATTSSGVNSRPRIRLVRRWPTMSPPQGRAGRAGAALAACAGARLVWCGRSRHPFNLAVSGLDAAHAAGL